MAYNARVFQILIASPGDVAQERDIVSEVIHEWNYLNAREKGIILLPLRWETHSSPEMGDRPQGIINRQVVDQCDMVVGVFWTKLGTPTGLAASGTIEEIDQAAEKGKIIMLYFSRAVVNPDKLDLEEYKRVKEFKLRKYPEGLVESYDTLPEFRDKFTKQLAMKVRDLVNRDASDLPTKNVETNLALYLALNTGASPQILQDNATVQINKIICTNEQDIPDFKAEILTRNNEVSLIFGENKNYYRELIRYYVKQKEYLPFRLALHNPSKVGLHDLYLELFIQNSGDQLEIIENRDFLRKPDKFANSTVIFRDMSRLTNQLRISRQESKWEMTIEVPVIQGGRTILSENEFFLGAKQTVEAILQATVYSSNSSPFVLATRVWLTVQERQMTYQDILADLGESLPSS